MRKKGELIMGVGHRVKSINNPDMRVTIIKVGFVLLLLFLPGMLCTTSFENRRRWRLTFNLLLLLSQDFLREHFPATPLLDYALEVEKITTSKKPNLILNVDGIIGVAFVDLLRHSGCFTRCVIHRAV